MYWTRKDPAARMIKFWCIFFIVTVPVLSVFIYYTYRATPDAPTLTPEQVVAQRQISYKAKQCIRCHHNMNCYSEIRKWKNDSSQIQRKKNRT
jgi:hypothetical protein